MSMANGIVESAANGSPATATPTATAIATATATAPATSTATATATATTTATSTSTSSGKRKRADGPGDDADIIGNAAEQDGRKIWLAQFLSDVMTILKRHDTTPSILNAPLPSATEDSAAEPTAKRPRLNTTSLGPTDHVTIASKISSAAYSNLKDVGLDVDRAGSVVQDSLLSDTASVDGSSATNKQHGSRDRDGVLARILTFKKIFASIILREKVQNGALRALDGHDGHVSEVARAGESAGEETLEHDHLAPPVENLPHRVSLTIYAIPPRPLQLFSGLAKRARLGLTSSALTLPDLFDPARPFDERKLPPGVSETTITPIHPLLEMDEKKSVPTIGENFPPPPTLPHLTPPKPSKLTMTRGPVVGWVNPSDPALIARSGRRGSYSTQAQLAGHWLHYGTVVPGTRSSSPEAKRRQRERALSQGENRPSPPEEEASALHAARAESLFRRAYSSFAPTRDDAHAMMPVPYKDRVWWERAGRDRFVKTGMADHVPGEAMLEMLEQHDADGSMEDVSSEDVSFEEAVEAWTPMDPREGFVAAKPPPQRDSVSEQEVDTVLREISDLLETLHSYQRIRNLSLTSGSRPTVPQENAISTMLGTPSSPSPAETDVYHLLRSQLALMISTLPPYAVAKLNGERMAELNVSTKILVPSKDYRGGLEEDDGTSKARVSTHPAVSPVVARNRPPSMAYHTPQPGHQSRPGHATQMPGTRVPASAPHLSGQYYHHQPPSTAPGGAPNGARAPATGGIVYQQPARGSRGQAANRAAGVAPHGGYPPTTPLNRPPQGQYGPTTNPQQHFHQQQQQQQHRPAGPAYGPSYQQAQPPLQTGGYQRPSQPQYQQNAQQRLQAQSLGGAVRPSGTLKPSPYSHVRETPVPVPGFPAPASSVVNHTARPYVQAPPPHPAPSSQPPPMMTTPATNHVNAGSLQAHHVGGVYPNGATTPTPLGASGFRTYLTPGQQATMMERQRAQLAAQQQRQQPPSSGTHHAPARVAQANAMTAGTPPIYAAQSNGAGMRQAAPAAAPVSGGAGTVQVNGVREHGAGTGRVSAVPVPGIGATAVRGAAGSANGANATNGAVNSVPNASTSNGAVPLSGISAGSVSVSAAPSSYMAASAPAAGVVAGSTPAGTMPVQAPMAPAATNAVTNSTNAVTQPPSAGLSSGVAAPGPSTANGGKTQSS